MNNRNPIYCFLKKIANEEPKDAVSAIGGAVAKIKKNVERRRDIRKQYGGHTPRSQDNSYFGSIKTLINLKR